MDYRGEGKERGGGLVCLWKNEVDAELLSLSGNHINLIIKDEDGEPRWRFSGIYGHLE